MSAKGSRNEDFPTDLFVETLFFSGIAYFVREIATGKGFWSDSQFRLFGYEPGEVEPDFPFVVSRVHPEDRSQFLQWNRELLDNDAPFNHVYRILRKDGKSIQVRSHIKIQRAPDGTPLKAFGILQDLSHKNDSEAKIRASEKALKEAQRIANIGSWSHNLQTHEMEWSDEMYRIAGIPKQKIHQELLFSLVYPEDIPRLKEAERASMEGEDYIDIEIRLLRPDGEVRYTQYRWRSIKDSQGQEIKRFGTIQDITEKKKVELERLRLERRILETEKLESLGLLAGGIAHDFNNLLTGVLGNADLLLGYLPEGSREHACAEGILKSAEAAAELVRNLLDFAGKRRGKLRPIQIEEVIENTLALLKPLIPSHVNISFECQEPLPVIQGDPLRIRQALMNILLNGAEALGTKPGNLWIRAKGKSTPPVEDTRRNWDKSMVSGPELLPEDALMIEIEDNGEGMSQETLEQIFEPFFTTKFSGHGLGLASTLEIIRSHGGQILIRSKKGEGSLFRILLPSKQKA